MNRTRQAVAALLQKLSFAPNITSTQGGQVLNIRDRTQVNQIRRAAAVRTSTSYGSLR